MRGFLLALVSYLICALSTVIRGDGELVDMFSPSTRSLLVSVLAEQVGLSRDLTPEQKFYVHFELSRSLYFEAMDLLAESSLKEKFVDDIKAASGIVVSLRVLASHRPFVLEESHLVDAVYLRYMNSQMAIMVENLKLMTTTFANTEICDDDHMSAFKSKAIALGDAVMACVSFLGNNALTSPLIDEAMRVLTSVGPACASAQITSLALGIGNVRASAAEPIQ